MLDPPAAGLDLARVGLVVDSAFAALDELEMLNGIGDVYSRAVDPRLLQRSVE
jgi:hypothetical protein